ncbi:hypothetical protein NOR_00468 [Metarhizium rileyi]|uniref:SRR1-like domain-containing protein n=1 Tax=Metarhizium rileyi (strain RCEF 4871) TaxID=1649241 RepID=A0A162I3L9_METRR|nr:hypothetical protein NOR_00468 [Metarhizium rileyi RCEF 4871]TWU77702.1 hypothetical protein ED733_008362 [Metarhizium rileyi]
MSDSQDVSAPPTEDEEAAQNAFVASVQALYNAGTPLFTKEMIRLAQERIDSLAEDLLPEEIELLGFDGKKHAQPFSLSLFTKADGQIYLPEIYFKSFESLTMPSPSPRGEESMISVCIVAASHTCGEKRPGTSQDDVKSAFDRYFRTWEQSEAWTTLEQQIRLHLPTLPKTIDKVIGFGLGDLTYDAIICGDDDGRKNRSSEQHALMLMLVRLFKEHTGNSVKCYAQDPMYADTCKGILVEKGVDVVHGNTGFLLVDENSIVLSFSPNIPVRQVIADLPRPAVMACDKISEPTRSEWQRMGTAWISPYSTDPVSPRVLAMREDYVELLIKTTETVESAVYLRKETIPNLSQGRVPSS